MDDDDSHGRYPCLFDGCERSFVRKEHMKRHERTHNPEAVHICRVCSRKFNRSDSLLRHLSRHGDVFKPSLSYRRSKQACIACHTGKVKCDGNSQCLSCLKRGVECKYAKEDGRWKKQLKSLPEVTVANLNSGIDSNIEKGVSVPVPVPVSVSEDERIPISFSGPPCASVPTSIISNLNLRVQPEPCNLQFHLKAPTPHSFIDWSTIRIQEDTSTSHDHPSEGTTQGTSDGTEKYLDVYFTYFHHRWPILHRPTYNDTSKGESLKILISSMKMMGAWLDGDAKSSQYSMSVYDRLMDQCFSKLSHVSSQDIFQQSLPAGLCQASLINIIFSLHCGNKKELSRGIILRNILIAVLREVGFFKTETIWADEKFFLPMHMMKLEERKRLAESLFKIDSYLSILRGQPPSLMGEELKFRLPQSFSLWNADGLQKWEQLQGNSPLSRSEKTISEMISDIALDSGGLPLEKMLLEDLQLCICAIQPSIWKLSERARDPKESEIGITLQRDALVRRLLRLKLQLDKMANQEVHLLMHHYYGFEDHNEPGWQPIVMARVKSLLFDTSMMYHLLNLHLYADIHTITQVAKDRSTNIEDIPQERQNEVRKRRCMIRGATGNANGRRALCHAADILTAYQNINIDSNQTSGLRSNMLDPIVYVALTTAAIFVWGYCEFGLHSCEICFPEFNPFNGGYDPTATVQLTKWSDMNGQHSECKEAWIEIGGEYEVELAGVQVCMCNTDALMEKFASCLPGGWDIAESIAPGVFKASGLAELIS